MKNFNTNHIEIILIFAGVFLAVYIMLICSIDIINSVMLCLLH